MCRSSANEWCEMECESLMADKGSMYMEISQKTVEHLSLQEQTQNDNLIRRRTVSD